MSDLQSDIDCMDQFFNDLIKAIKDSGKYGVGATTGAAIGGICFGPLGALVVAGLGILSAYSISPKACVKYSDVEMATGRAARGPGLKIQARGPHGPKRALKFFI